MNCNDCCNPIERCTCSAFGSEVETKFFTAPKPEAQAAGVDDTVQVCANVAFGDDWFTQMMVDGVMFLVPLEHQDRGRHILAAKKRRSTPASPAAHRPACRFCRRVDGCGDEVAAQNAGTEPRCLREQPAVVGDEKRALERLVGAAGLMLAEIDTCGHEVDPTYRRYLHDAWTIGKEAITPAATPGEQKGDGDV